MRGSAWQCVAVRCSALQCVAVCRKSLKSQRNSSCPTHVLQCVAVCVCSVFQCIAVRCSVSLNSQRNLSYPTHVCCSVLQRVLQCVAVCCNVLLCVAVYRKSQRIASCSKHERIISSTCTLIAGFRVSFRSTHCSTLQHDGAQWFTLQQRCTKLQHTTPHNNTSTTGSQVFFTATHSNTPHCIATHCSHLNSRILSLPHAPLSNTLHHAATRCTTLQHAAPHCRSPQEPDPGSPTCAAEHHTAIHCTTVHHSATHCTTLQNYATHCGHLTSRVRNPPHAPLSIALQHTATHCNTLQHTAPRCNTLQSP